MSHAQPDDGARPLKNGKDEAFCREAVALDSIHKGYEAAGFKRPRGNADRKARQPNIARRLEYLRMQAATLAGVSLGRVLIEQARLAFANMDDFVRITGPGEPAIGKDGSPVLLEDGSPVLMPAGIPILDLGRLRTMPDHERRAMMAAVKSVRYTEHGPAFELHDKPGVLRDLKKHVGGDAPTNVALTGQGNVTFVIEG